LVVGYSDEHCPKATRDLAYEVGREVARQGSVLVSGGLGGVMEASCKGAKEEGGLTVCIIPQEERVYANKYCDVVIPTGIGFMRDFVTAHSADAVIIVGGGIGTLIEVSVAYFDAKPIISLMGSGGTADKIAGTFLDDRKIVEIHSADSPQEAVNKALSLIRLKKRR
jgi:uncharacterized protein (TIGR00725 family)